MKYKLLLLLLFFGQLLPAQTFSEVLPAFPFDAASQGSVAFSDVDGDGDKDVLITGENGARDPIAKLYTNNEGRFTEVAGTPFEGVWHSSVAFADVDGDGDNDVLITGLNGVEERVTKLYTNDGGNFTETAGTPFDDVSFSAVAFSDVDGDGDSDVLITGGSSELIAKLYTNDGGRFTEVLDTPFEGVRYSSVTFSDVDGDGDKDVLITGNGSLGAIAKLYTNDGGSFTEAVGTPFEGVWFGSVAFSDVDSDGDNDVLITGSKGSGDRITKLYTNDGGSFTEAVDTPFECVGFSSVAFSDVDGDGDKDVLITGRNVADERISKLYTNDGGSFTEAANILFEGVFLSAVAFSDVDDDGDSDVLIMGVNGSSERIAKIYTNVGDRFTPPPFEGVYRGAVAFSDVDGDGDKDVLITGNGSLGATAKLYTNNGGRFTEATGTPFEGVYLSSVAFSDVDGDDDNDVLITGVNGSSERIAKLYTNDGGNFTESVGTPFDGVLDGSVAFSDVDGDGDKDVLITGANGTSELIAKLYTNDGGSFTEVMGTSFYGVAASSVAFSDVDGDGDNDLLITGVNGSLGAISKLYTNDGGSFTEAAGTPFEGVAASSVAFSDVDGDGDNDVLITGRNGSSEPIAKLYTNDGGSFTEVAGTPFDDVAFSSVAFSDVDGDGDKDVLITGLDGSLEPISKLYTNVGGSFTESVGTPFDGVRESAIAFSDVDGDGDGDLLITGVNGLLGPISKLYTNDGLVSSIDDLLTANRFKFTLYPNPTKANKLNIRYDSGGIGLVTIEVFDLNGRPLSQQQKRSVVGQQTFSIDIASLNRGSYVIQLDDGKISDVRIFLVQ